MVLMILIEGNLDHHVKADNRQEVRYKHFILSNKNGVTLLVIILLGVLKTTLIHLENS